MNFNCNEIECNLAGLMNKLITGQSQLKPKGKETALVITSGPRRAKNKKKKTKKQAGELGAQGGVDKEKGKAPVIRK